MELEAVGAILGGKKRGGEGSPPLHIASIKSNIGKWWCWW